MKKLFTLLALIISFSVHSQTITSLNPNQSNPGTTLTTVITGQNTFFMTASMQGNLFFRLSDEGGCSIVYGDQIHPFNEDSVSVDFAIPSNWANGPHKLLVDAGTYSITKDSAVTIIGSTDYSLQNITPNNANENSVLTATITGLNLSTLMTIPGTSVYLQQSPAHRYFGTNRQTINSNTITVDFSFPTYCDTGIFDFVVSSSAGCYTIPNAMFVHGNFPKQLLSINPTQANAGTSLTATITGQNTFLMTGGIQSFQNIQLKDQNCHVINGSNGVVIDDDHFTADFNIPSTAINGVYDLYVKLLSGPSFSLPLAFTISGGETHVVNNFSPSSANAGTTVNATVTGLRIDSIFKFASVKLISNGGYQLSATNIIATAGQATMDFVVPIFADNGFYKLQITSATGCYSIDQALQMQGASPRGLISIVPDSGVRGQPLTSVITGSYAFFLNGTQSDVQKIRFENINDHVIFDVVAPNFVVNDSDHITLNSTIPLTASRGLYKVTVSLLSGLSYSLNPGFEISGSRISGIVYLDVDSSGTFNTGDVSLNNKKVLLLPDSIISLSGNNGQFDFGVDSGQYTIEFYSDTEWVVTTSPHPISVHVDSTDISGLHIGLQPVHDKYEMYITTVGAFPRCSWTIGYDLTYRNNSTTVANGIVAFIPDVNLAVSSSIPPADFTSGDTLFWNYDSLVVSAYGSIHLNVIIPLTAGTILKSYSIIKALDGFGNILSSHIDSLFQSVRCSYDPNDKSVSPEGQDAGHYTLIGNYLEYLIRFQNTGNDTAFQVIILDSLDLDLSPSSLEVVASSHPVETHIDGRVVEFRFNNILLPDSNVDEPGSHGYVKYRVLPSNFNNIGAIVNNTARIYFDLNQAIVTNTTLNTLVDFLPNGISVIDAKGNLLVYPNPTTGQFTLLYNNQANQKMYLSIYNVNGSIVKTNETKGEIIEMNASDMNPGMYFILLHSSDGKVSYKGKIVVR